MKMKKVFQIIFLVLIQSCDSKKNAAELLADKEFELCSEIRYNNSIGMGPINGNLNDKKNIHNRLEKFLISKKHLTGINKKGYSELFDKIKNKEIKTDFFVEFKKELGFEPYLLFPVIGQMQCYDMITLRKKIIDETSWQYQLMEAYWKIEAAGDLNFEDGNLKNVLSKIPEDKFQLIMYRKLFLDLIYFHLN
jgi:hypothetical protein